MSGYNPYATGHGHHGPAQGNGTDGLHMAGNGEMMGQGNSMDAMAGQSLDDIVNQNASLMRRQSMPQIYDPRQQPAPPQNMDTDDPRRMSMMEFTGASPTAPLDSFQFNMQNPEMVDASAYMASQSNANMRGPRKRSNDDMALDNGFNHPSTSYMPMMPPTSSYQSPANLSNLDMDLNSPYINTPLNMTSIGYNSPNVDRSMAMFNHTTPYHPSMLSSPMHSNVPNHVYAASPEAGGPPKRPSLENTQSRSSTSQNMQSTHQQSRQPTPHHRNSHAPQMQHSHSNPSGAGFKAQPQHPQPGSQQDVGMDRGRGSDAAGPQPDVSKHNPNNQGFNWPTPEGLSRLSVSIFVAN